VPGEYGHSSLKNRGPSDAPPHTPSFLLKNISNDFNKKLAVYDDCVPSSTA
jgi:hypothetical protein